MAHPEGIRQGPGHGVGALMAKRKAPDAAGTKAAASRRGGARGGRGARTPKAESRGQARSALAAGTPVEPAPRDEPEGSVPPTALATPTPTAALVPVTPIAGPPVASAAGEVPAAPASGAPAAGAGAGGTVGTGVATNIPPDHPRA